MPHRPTDPYDDVPYTDHSYAESHPDRLAVVAKMSGWTPPAVERARILELGCGVGGNLLPMAEQLPGATLVGVDRSRRQIEAARRVAEAAGLKNVVFHEASFEDAGLVAAEFDFVICHGVYSWISIDARRALLRVVARCLAPGGVAYLSFNTLPGWYDRMAARDWLRFADATSIEPLSWLKARVSLELDAYRRQLGQVEDRLRETERAYLVHEYLSTEHHPELVTSVLGEAGDAGLRYLGDAIPTSTAVELLDDEAQARALGLDVAATQQLVDFVKHTSFRRALFVRSDASDERAWCWPMRLDPRAIDSSRIASRLRITADPAGGADRIEGPDGIVHVFDPLARCALHELSLVAPRSLAFDELCQRVRAAMPTADGSSKVSDAVRSELFDLWLTIGGLDLHAYEPRMATTVSERPEASAVARIQARTDGTLTNVWHQEVRLVEEVVRFALARLDGTRTCGALTREVRERMLPESSSADVEALVRASLDLLAKSALLVQ